MKTLDEVIASFKGVCLDGRDIERLIDFVPESRLSEIGIILKPEFVGTHVPEAWTRENILAHLKKDVAFGFEKALNKRGISASLMNDVVIMWNWILEDGLESNEYAEYGLPLLKITAVKYGFPNPIGDKVGNEREFASGSDDE